MALHAAGFVLAALAVWRAGVRLSISTDALARRFGFGEALGGMIGLAVVNNLPELAIVLAAARRGELELATGNLLGGIALQTVVLAFIDAAGIGRRGDPLTRRASHPVVMLQAVLVLAVLALVLIGHQLPLQLHAARLTPAVVLIALTWMAVLYLVARARGETPMNGAPAPGVRSAKPDTRRELLVFAGCALLTLIGGVTLEITSKAIADQWGWHSAVFGGTVLAAATALPELSTDLEALRLRDYRLAMSDIFGGNAYLPVLFLLAELLSGQALLPRAQPSDLYLSQLGMLLTAIYLAGLILRPRRRLGPMGLDSALVVLVYALGIAGLALLPD
jgi:cation:H+ antiporter